MQRKHLLQLSTILCSLLLNVVFAADRSLGETETRTYPPVRQITRGPRHHWFGYYDKLQFDPTSRYVLGMEVTFQHRSPTADDVIQIGMVDLQDNDRWIELGESRSWCWQQGCMLQWLPGSATKVLWNDRVGDRFVCHILDIKSREKQTIQQPIYSVSPDGKSAVTADFRRIQDVRPGYGYAGLPDPYVDDLAPRDSGIFHIDLETGESKLIISLFDITRLGEIPNKAFGINITSTTCCSVLTVRGSSHCTVGDIPMANG